MSEVKSSEVKSESKSSKTKVLDLADLFATYDIPLDENFAANILERKEFAELPAEVNEVITIGKPLNQQKFIGRVMQVIDRLLLMWDPGTGKSCAIAEPSERARMYSRLAGQDAKIRRVVILVRGPGNEIEMRKQIMCRCTQNAFSTPSSTAKRAADKTFKAYYYVTTWFKFVSSLKEEVKIQGNEGKGKTKVLDIETAKLLYSGTLFIVDEVHNLSGSYLRSKGNAAENSTYASLWQIFHNVPNISVILSSATPMFDTVNEIVPVMNLILDEDDQMEDIYDWANVEISDLAKYFIGRVSYVRATENNIKINYVASKNEPRGYREYITKNLLVSEDNIYWVPMSDLQRRAYGSNILDLDIDNGNIDIFGEGEEKKDGLGFPQRSVLHAVFPDGGIDNTNEKWIRNEDKDNFSPTPAFLEALESNLNELSPRYEAIYNEVVTNDKCYIYFHFITRVWAQYFSCVLLSKGYERFATPEKKRVRGTGYCNQSIEDTDVEVLDLSIQDELSNEADVTDNKYGMNVGNVGNASIANDINIEPKLRFAIITGKTSNPVKREILRIYNHPLNYDGSYIKFIIASPVFREAYSLFDISYIVVAGPHWNRRAPIQAEYRGIRTGSHNNRLERDNESRHLGLVNVRVLYFGVYDDTLDFDDPKQTIDVKMYLVSLRKDIPIARVMRIMKICSIDCLLNSSRNRINDENKDNTVTCDYMECKYPCLSDYDKNKVGYITDTFDRYYIDDYIKDMSDQIKSLMRRNNSWYIDDLLLNIDFGRILNSGSNNNNEKLRYLNYTLDYMITNNIYVTDSMNFPCYIQKISNMVIGVRGLNSNGVNTGLNNIDYDSLYYNNCIFVEDSVDLKSLTANKIIVTLESHSTDEEILNNLNRELYLESALLHDLLGTTTEFDKRVMQLFKGYYYRLRLPITAINSASSRGERKINKYVLQQVDLPTIDTDTPPVYISFLSVYYNGSQRYEIVSSYFNPIDGMRLLECNQVEQLISSGINDESILMKAWRNLSANETTAYNKILQILNLSKINVFERNDEIDAYGMIMSDGQLRIVDKRENKTTDARKINRGRACGSIKRPALVSLYFRLSDRQHINISLPSIEIQIEQISDLPNIPNINEMTEEQITKYYMIYIISKKSKGSNIEMYEYLLDPNNEEELNFTYDRITSSMSRDQMCVRIRDYLNKNHLIWTPLFDIDPRYAGYIFSDEEMREWKRVDTI